MHKDKCHVQLLQAGLPFNQADLRVKLRQLEKYYKRTIGKRYILKRYQCVTLLLWKAYSTPL